MRFEIKIAVYHANGIQDRTVVIIIKVSTCLLKTQLAKVGVSFKHVHLVGNKNQEQLLPAIGTCAVVRRRIFLLRYLKFQNTRYIFICRKIRKIPTSACAANCLFLANLLFCSLHVFFNQRCKGTSSQL